MNSLYIHIPFCKTRCGYCDFHSSTCFSNQGKYVSALCSEIKQRQDYLPSRSLATVYFGGGTPSLLSAQEIRCIFDCIKQYFTLEDECEITMEMNPDDINHSYLTEIKNTGINRLSIGIQSFDNDDLKNIGRRHSAQKAIDAVRLAQSLGFNNISIDLIFGLPFQDIDKWKKNLDTAFSLGIQHISSYALIYEEGTAFYDKMQKGIYTEVDDELSLEMYSTLISEAEKNGFMHYETSNFALPNLHSIHNSNYWSGNAYLGIGAGAHSYNGSCRQWNVSNNDNYIKGIISEKPVCETETIDSITAYNEYIMTGLRTMWGCDIEQLKERFGAEMLQFCIRCATPYINSGQILITENKMTIAKDAIFISDQIMSDLMWVE